MNLTRRRPTHAHGQRRLAPVKQRTGSVRAGRAPRPSPSCSHFARCGVFRISIRRASAHGHLSQDDSMLALGAAESLSDALPRVLSLRHSIINSRYSDQHLIKGAARGQRAAAPPDPAKTSAPSVRTYGGSAVRRYLPPVRAVLTHVLPHAHESRVRISRGTRARYSCTAQSRNTNTNMNLKCCC